MNSINVTRSSIPPFEEYCEEIRDIWDSRILTNNGVKYKKLKEQLTEWFNTNYIVMFTNGHLALESAIEAFDLQGEVITTPFTFASTTHAIIRKGLTPTFCDIREDDYTIDTDKIETLITEKTSAIVAVHVYGNVCDHEKIAKIADKYGLKVIYDAAHAFGVNIGDKSVAELGNASVFSFHATKVFNTIEGGAVAYKEAAIGDKLEKIKNYGIIGPEEVVYSGGNAKMSEFQAAMGICNLRHLQHNIRERKKIVELYRRLLSGVDGIRASCEKTGVTSNYAYFPVNFEGYKYSRDQIFSRLCEQNIYARKYFYPIVNTFTCYRNQNFVKKTPIAEKISNNILTLPLYSELNEEDVVRICNIIKG